MPTIGVDKKTPHQGGKSKFLVPTIGVDKKTPHQGGGFDRLEFQITSGQTLPLLCGVPVDHRHITFQRVDGASTQECMTQCSGGRA